MKKIVQRIIIIFVSSLFTALAVAQQPADTLMQVPFDLQENTISEETALRQHLYELSIWGGAGLSSLNYDLSLGERRVGPNFLAGVGCSVFFNDHWSVGLGVEVSLLNSSAVISRFSDYYPVTTSFGLTPPLNLEIIGYDYTQHFNLYYLNVPLILRYQFDVWKQYKLYVAGGLKLGLPLSSSYTAEGSYMSRAFDRDANGKNMGDPIQGILGFGDYQLNDKGDWGVKMNTILALEVGMKWRLSEKLALYSGLYLDYGLNDLRKNNAASGGRLIDYLETEQDYDRKSTPLPEAVYALKNSTTVQNFSGGRINSFSMGLKLQLSFGMKLRHSKQAEIRNIIEPVSQRTSPQEKAPDETLSQSSIVNSLNSRLEAITALLEKEQKARREQEQKQEQDEEFRIVYGFDLNSAIIVDNMLPALLHNATILRKHKTMKVTLEGHTDEIGSDSYNLDLGLRRAQAVRDWLIANGIKDNRIAIDSKGKTQPLMNVNEASKRYNRRVVFIVMR